MDKKIQYTDTATRRLSKLHNDLDDKLETYFRSNKYVPGEDFIEITAADVEEVSKRIEIIEFKGTYLLAQNVVVFYAVVGAIATFVGLFYDSFLELIITQNRTRLMLLIIGLFLLIFGIIGYWALRARNKRATQLEMLIKERELLNSIKKQIYTENESDLN